MPDESTLEGGCLCATVRYRIRAPFGRAFYCHCSRCRKASGSAFAANAAVASERFAFVSGETK
ncbi:GFA family protein [Ramlibacter sp.]|uniref:GFA family protein n=1 Tax=Ramlibacter sp. TaxID=1917967 RepID=UPI0039C9C34B